MKATLTYHSIDDSQSPISVSMDAFEGHLRWLASGRVQVLSLNDLMKHPVGGDDAVAITFDDGFLNVRGVIDRLLDSGLPCSIFAVTGHVGGTNDWGGKSQPGIPTLPLLTWRDLEQLLARGANVEAHTRTHPKLTTIADPDLDAELLDCREDLRARLGIVSRHVAYPYGDVDSRVAHYASLHYGCGHTTEMRVIGRGAEGMHMPRVDMYYFRTPDGLDSWGSPAFARRLKWIRARRRARATLVSYHPLLGT